MVLLLRFSTGENWNGFMYDMNADREGCESSPEYNPDVCGFTDHANCEPLNGCGTWTIFPYMITWVLRHVVFIGQQFVDGCFAPVFRAWLSHLFFRVLCAHGRKSWSVTT